MSTTNRDHRRLSRLENEDDLFLEFFQDDDLEFEVYSEGYLKKLVTEEDIMEINELL